MSGAISHTQRLPLASARVRPRFLTPCTARFTRSIRQLERENAKLLQRLTLLLHQGGWRAAAAPTAADARKLYVLSRMPCFAHWERAALECLADGALAARCRERENPSQP